MKSVYILLSILLISIITLPVIAQNDSQNQQDESKKSLIRLAIMDLKPNGVSAVVASGVSALLRSEIVDTGRFIVVERSQMDLVLKEQGFQQTGCTDSSCAVQMGKLLSANKVLIGEVNQLGDATHIIVRIVDVEKGVAEFSTSEKARDMNDIDRATKTLTDKLIGRITGKRPIAVEEKAITPLGYYLRGTVPGWGQWYTGRSRNASIYGGTFLLSGAYLAYSTMMYYQAKDDYNALRLGTSKNEFSSKRKTYKDAAVQLNVSLGLFSLVYILNWVDLILFRPDFTREERACLKNRFFEIGAYASVINSNSVESIVTASYGMRL